MLIFQFSIQLTDKNDKIYWHASHLFEWERSYILVYFDMNQKYFDILLIFLLLLLSCSSSKETSDLKVDVKPSPSVIISDNLKITIPNYWREIDDNHNRLFEIWLVRDDTNAVISFIPVNLSENFNAGNKNEELSLIEKIIFAKKESGNLNFKLVEKGTLPSKYSNISISYYLGDQFQSSIIFGENNVFYECLMYFNDKYAPEASEIEEMLQLQKSIVLESIIK